jgi:hypothetical protein
MKNAVENLCIWYKSVLKIMSFHMIILDSIFKKLRIGKIWNKTKEEIKKIIKINKINNIKEIMNND